MALMRAEADSRRREPTTREKGKSRAGQTLLYGKRLTAALHGRTPRCFYEAFFFPTFSR